jgi:hypothetical protein
MHSVAIDKYSLSLKVIKELKKITVYLKKWSIGKANIIQNHRQVKRKLPYRNNSQSTYTTVTMSKRLKTVSALYKESRREITTM